MTKAATQRPITVRRRSWHQAASLRIRRSYRRAALVAGASRTPIGRVASVLPSGGAFGDRRLPVVTRRTVRGGPDQSAAHTRQPRAGATWDCRPIGRRRLFSPNLERLIDSGCMTATLSMGAGSLVGREAGASRSGGERGGRGAGGLPPRNRGHRQVRAPPDLPRPPARGRRRASSSSIAAPSSRPNAGSCMAPATSGSLGELVEHVRRRGAGRAHAGPLRGVPADGHVATPGARAGVARRREAGARRA